MFMFMSYCVSIITCFDSYTRIMLCIQVWPISCVRNCIGSVSVELGVPLRSVRRNVLTSRAVGRSALRVLCGLLSVERIRCTRLETCSDLCFAVLCCVGLTLHCTNNGFVRKDWKYHIRMQWCKCMTKTWCFMHARIGIKGRDLSGNGIKCPWAFASKEGDCVSLLMRLK